MDNNPKVMTIEQQALAPMTDNLNTLPTGDVGALVERLDLHKSWRDSHGELNDAPNQAAATIRALTAEVEMKADTVEWFSADEPMGMRCAAVTTLTAEVEHKTFGQLEAVAQLKLLKSKLLGG